MKSLRIISTGFAMFAMLFGAANVVYPLALGRTVGEMVWFALGGFALSAVCIPLIGFLSALLFEGNYKNFFARVGQTPGFLLIMFCLMLIGPFFVSPRCITIAYASVQMYLPSISLWMFSIFAAALIFIATVRPGKVLSLLGKVLGPIKLILLLAIIIKGLLKPTHFATTTLTAAQSFGLGFTEGFWTLDLLATIFFSGLLLSGLSTKEERTEANRKERFIDGIWAGLFGMSLLAIVYTGFCIVSAMHSSQLPPVDKVGLLSALSVYILGEMGGLFANIVVSVACLTTAIALTSLFADYIRREIFNKKLSHLPCLLITIAITVVMTSLGFDKLAQILLPIVLISYPAILVLAIVNIAHKLWGFTYVKTPFFIALVGSVAHYYGLFGRLLG